MSDDGVAVQESANACYEQYWQRKDGFNLLPLGTRFVGLLDCPFPIAGSVS